MSWQDLADFGMGMAGVNMNHQRAREEELRVRQEAERRMQEKAVFEMAQIQQNMAKAAKDAELESAGREAKTGVRENEELTQFLSAYGGNPQTMIGTAEEAQANNKFAPGLYMRADNQAEAYARAKQTDEDDKLFREVSGFEAKRDQDAASSRRSERTEDRLGQEFDLDKQKFARQEKQDPLQQRYVQKRIEQIDADIAAQPIKGRMTMAQARALAYKGMDGDSLDADSIQKAEAAAHLIELYANTEGSNRDQLLRALADGATPSVFADDALQQGAGGDLKSQIEKANQDAGEPANFGKEEQGAGKPPTPHMPGIDGQPDSDWMDESISFLDMIGANKKMNNKIEEEAMTQDMHTLEWEVRYMGSLGVPEDEMPEKHRTFLKALRDPDKAMQGLQAQ